MNTPAKFILHVLPFLAVFQSALHSEAASFTITESITWNGNLMDTASVSMRGFSARGTLKSAIPWKGASPGENVTLPTWSIALSPLAGISILGGAIARAGTPARLANLPSAELAMTIPSIRSISGSAQSPVISPGNSTDTAFIGIDLSAGSWRAVCFASPQKFNENPSWLQVTKTSPSGSDSPFRYSVTTFSGIAHPDQGKNKSWLLDKKENNPAPILLPGVEYIMRLGPVAAGFLLSANLGALVKPSGAIKADIALKGKHFALAGDLFFAGNNYTELDGDIAAVTERFSVSAAILSPPMRPAGLTIGTGAGAKVERQTAKSLQIIPGRSISAHGELTVENRQFRAETVLNAEPENMAFSGRITIPYCFFPNIRFDVSAKTRIIHKKYAELEAKNMEGRIRVRITEIGSFSVESEISAKKSDTESPPYLGAKMKLMFHRKTSSAGWDCFLSADRPAAGDTDPQDGKPYFLAGLTLSAGVAARFR
jgi:hypothetical protein